MTTHEQYQDELPAYIARRLGDEERLRLEEHLEECEECRAIVATWADLSPVLHEDVETLFEPHPGEMELRDFALGGADSARTRIQRHLAACGSCELEIRAWQSLPRASRAPRRVGAGTRRLRIPGIALGAAAGLVAGMGLAFLIPGLRSGEGVAVGEPVQHLVLPASPLRGNGVIPALRLPRAQRHLVIDFGLPAPREAEGEASYRFQILRETGTEIWSREMPAASLRKRLGSEGLIGFVFPTTLLPPGRYHGRVVPPGVTDERSVPRLAFEILPPE